MKRFLRSLAVAAALIAGVCAAQSAALADVQVTINGNPVGVNPAPILQAGRVFVPLRSVFENLGASVDYSNGQINATANGTQISLTIGSTQASVDGSPVTIDVAPFIVGDYTYVPLRFISQSLGASVSWDDSTQTVEISDNNAPDQSGYNDQNYDDQDVSQEPPPIPYYEPPPVPAPNYVWMPGYWAWGFAGYYWVPGTWVQAPQPGLYWTPGYWGWNNGSYAWHTGYWAAQIGFYGGVNYGGGYFGRGFAGGQWSHDSFRYNTAVVNVTNTTVIRNVYVDRTVIAQDTTTNNRVSFNGGPHGVNARPTSQELAATRIRHVAMTAAQQQHVQVAASDRALLQKVNGGKPPVVAAPHPFTQAAKPAGYVPLKPQDRIAAPRPAPAHTVAPHPKMTARPVPARPAPVKTAPTVVRPVRHPMPSHPVATARPMPGRPAPVKTAPTIVRPVRHPMPSHPAATARPVPAHPVPAHPAPVQPAARPHPAPEKPHATPTPEDRHTPQPR